jgi:hypothetical protein
MTQLLRSVVNLRKMLSKLYAHTIPNSMPSSFMALTKLTSRATLAQIGVTSCGDSMSDGGDIKSVA